MVGGARAQRSEKQGNVKDPGKEAPAFTLNSFDGKVACSSESEVMLGGLLRCPSEQVCLRAREAQCIEVQGKFDPLFSVGRLRKLPPVFWFASLPDRC